MVGNRFRNPGWCNSQGFDSSTLRHFVDIAQSVERNLAKVEAAGSSPAIHSAKLSASEVFLVACQVSILEDRVRIPAGALLELGHDRPI